MNFRHSFLKKFFLAFIVGSFFLSTPGVQAVQEQYISDNSARQDPLKAQKQQGNFSVGEFTGAAIYDYPLTLPEGRNGMTPTLSLTHNSQDTALHNLVGYKWSLNEFSIKRLNTHGVERLYDQNGVIGLNDFIVNTPISSGEIIATNLSDDHHGLYAEKYESTFAKYEYKEDGSWVMTDKNGTRYSFGQTEAGRQFDPQDPNRTYQWMLEEIRDKNDNFIRFTYQKFDNQIYPASIRYTGHGEEQGIFEVKFIVNTQTKRADTQFSYASGFLVTTNYVVNVIEIYANNTLRRKYDLNYGTVDPLVRKVLTGITETGYDQKGKPTALPPTTFEYTPSVLSWQETEQYKPLNVNIARCHKNISCSTHPKAFFWDMTGDGLVDIPQDNDQDPNQKLYVNDGKGGWIEKPKTGYFIPQGALPHVSTKLTDFDGDTRIDSLASYFDVNNGTLVKSNLRLVRNLSNINDTVKIAMKGLYNDDIFADNGSSVADLNGDGLPDIIQKRDKTSQPDTQDTCLNQDGNACVITNLWKSPEYLIRDNINYQLNRSTYIEDCNADGLADISHSTPPYKWINDGKGGFVLPTVDQINQCQFTTMDGLYWRTTDLNADGFMDQVRALINAGPETITNELKLNSGQGLLPDVGNAPVLFGRGNGSGQTDTDLTGVRIMDINGDQLPDFVQSYFEQEQQGNQYIYTEKKHVWLHTGSKPYFLKTIHTSSGSKIDLEYKPSTQYLKEDQTQANPKLPIIVDTVKKVSVNDGLGNTTTTDYFYQDGHYYFKNSYDKVFAGFGVVTKTDTLGNKTKTFYHQGLDSVDYVNLGEYQDDISKKGRAFRTELYGPNNTLVSKTINRFEHKILAGEHVFPYLSQTLTQTFDGGVTKSIAQAFKYDKIGNKIEVLDYGEVIAQNDDGTFTDTDNDLLKTLISIIDQTAYPFENRVLDASDNLLTHSRVYYDNLALGKVDSGNVTAQEQWLNTKKNWVRSETKFNEYGLPISLTNPRGFSSTIEYDKYNLYPFKSINVKGHQTQFSYDLAIGQPLSITDPNGLVTTTIYDGLGRPLQTAQDGKVMQTIKYTDNLKPRAVLVRMYNNDGEKVDQYTYLDGLGRTVETKQEAPGGKWTTAQVIYDPQGNIKKQIQPYFSQNFAFEPLDEAKVGSAMTYDALNRPLTVVTPLGTTTSSYKGFETTVTDAEGHPKALVFDARKNLVRVDEHNEGEVYQTYYDYSPLGQLIKTTDDQGNTRNYAYDSLGRRLWMSQLNGQEKWNYKYDENGNLIGKSDPKKQLTVYTYDELDRLILEEGEPKMVTEYVYDKGDFAIGRLAQVSTGQYTHDYNYDKKGRIVQDYKTINGKLFDFGYAYDQMGAITKITYPDQTVVDYVYDAAHQLKEIKSGGVTYAQNFEYLPTGQVGHMKLGTGIEVVTTYDPAKLYQLVSKKAVNGQTILQNYSYDFDSIGNVTKLVDQNPGLTSKTVDYVYDDLSRLKEANYSGLPEGENFSENFAYDPIGNMTFKSGVGDYVYTSPNHPHAVATVGDNIYKYDENGNMILRDAEVMVYDYKDRLISSGEEAEFIYNEGTDRIMKKDLQTGELTLYPDKLYELHKDKSIKYIYAGESRIAKIEKTINSKDGSLFYLLTDHLDSIDTVLDESGNVVERQDYFAFGAERITEATDSAPDTDHGYTGKELDEETGLNYYGARYYDSEVGRFTAVDPWEGDLKMPQTLNKYSYVANNPIKYVDPTGERLEIEGNQEFVNRTFTDLQKISPYVMLNKDNSIEVNYVQMVADLKNEHDIKNFFGSALISNLVADKNTTTIQYSKGDNEAYVADDSKGFFDRFNLTNGEGVNMIVGYDPKENVNINTLDSKGNSVTEVAPGFINLSHELIHAMHYVTGDVTGDRNDTSNYRAANGAIDFAPKEEIRTVGLGFNKGHDITENQIRKENGLNIRNRY